MYKDAGTPAKVLGSSLIYYKHFMDIGTMSIERVPHPCNMISTFMFINAIFAKAFSPSLFT